MQRVEEDKGRRARTAVAYASGILAVFRQNARFMLRDPVPAVMAILVLWAYNQLVGKPGLRNKSDARPITTSGEIKERKVTVRLDRAGPFAARLSGDVHAWRDGQSGLKPSVHGVANICRPSAGIRLLEIGIEILRDMRGWSLSHGLIAWFGGMLARCDEGPESAQ
jgi:hypothetical protein